MPTDTDPTAILDLHCGECGAVLPPKSTVCWLCNASLGAHPSPEAPQAARFPPPSESLGGFSLASLMMFMTLVCVVLGVSTLWPGLGIPLGFLFFAAWLRTTVLTRWRARRGLAVKPIEQMQLFAASFGVTTGLLAIIGVAGFAAFWAACFTCLGTYFGLEPVLGENVAMPLAYIVCGLVSLAMLFVALRYFLPLVNRLVRRRWRRDSGEPD
jgi:hypothetical protein